MKPFSERLKKYLKTRFKYVDTAEAVLQADRLESDGKTPAQILAVFRAYVTYGGKGIFGSVTVSNMIVDTLRADLDAGKIPQYNYTKCGGRTPGAKNAKRTKMELMQRHEIKLLKARLAELEEKYENAK